MGIGRVYDVGDSVSVVMEKECERKLQRRKSVDAVGDEGNKTRLQSETEKGKGEDTRTQVQHAERTE